MDFAAELMKLLEAEELPPTDPLVELAQSQGGEDKELEKTLLQKNDDISLQIEEIYDIIKEADENSKELKAAAKRENSLIAAIIASGDLLDNVLHYLRGLGEDDANIISSQRDIALASCDIERLGVPGERLDPRFHTVGDGEFSEMPFETVTQVLDSGYVYRGKVLRKATVVISKGEEPVIAFKDTIDADSGLIDGLEGIGVVNGESQDIQALIGDFELDIEHGAVDGERVDTKGSSIDNTSLPDDGSPGTRAVLVKTVIPPALLDSIQARAVKFLRIFKKKKKMK